MTKYNDHGNLAHELELPYEDNPEHGRTAVHEEKKRPKAIPAAPAMSIGAKVAWAILLIIAVSLMGSLIYGKVEISRLYSERAGLEKQLDQLQNENVSMQSEIAERMNMTKVEEYARNELGLQKLDKSQIEYIEIETPSVAEVKGGEKEDVLSRFKRWIDHASEYLGH
ncbi:MAG: cell division protein FtsL [Ruminococcus sp.]|uniref:septum formation initiator family protein n=1 Tax=Ruminococcus sp. TaxID=41978 RepID=UPI0025E9B45E|nr:septum formation initiator family protein [Ruminococcus sp.]MCR5541566.1 cell division protein FtsL [Ruminococcus sp.]